MRKGAAFVFGWLVSLAIVVTATVLATGNNPPKPNTAPSLGSAGGAGSPSGRSWSRLAIRQRRQDAAAEEAEEAAEVAGRTWTTCPRGSPWAWPRRSSPGCLIGAGAATVVEAKLSSWESYLALFGFCVLASASYLAMEIYAGFRPGQSQALLARFRTWMDTHTDQVIIVGSLLLGFWLIGDS